MESDDQRIEREAYEFVKKNTKLLLERFAPALQHFSVDTPVSLFMAGSPGAGKTEVSEGLIKEFQSMPVRIDADEIRAFCPGYTGVNAHLFQKAATKGVNILLDHVLHGNINLILDGTFSYGDSSKNIERSLRHKRKVSLWFVYQEPLNAWKFTQAREAIEHRRILKDRFIETFFKSRQNAVAAKRQFGDQLELNLLIKNIDNTPKEAKLNISADQLDRAVGSGYTEENLKTVLI